MTVLLVQSTHHIATADALLDIIAFSELTWVTHHGHLPAPALSKHVLIYCEYKLQPTKSKFVLRLLI